LKSSAVKRVCGTRIRYGIATNVEELDQEGRPVIGRCFLPIGYLVAGDVMLAQKIALETNERPALAVALPFRNAGWLRPSQQS
jgi:hypothetical protein